MPAKQRVQFTFSCRPAARCTDLLSDQVARVRIVAIIALTLFEDDPEQIRMRGFIARSQFGRGFLVGGIGTGFLARRGGIKGDGHVDSDTGRVVLARC